MAEAAVGGVLKPGWVVHHQVAANAQRSLMPREDPRLVSDVDRRVKDSRILSPLTGRLSFLEDLDHSIRTVVFVEPGGRLGGQAAELAWIVEKRGATGRRFRPRRRPADGGTTGNAQEFFVSS